MPSLHSDRRSESQQVERLSETLLGAAGVGPRWVKFLTSEMGCLMVVFQCFPDNKTTNGFQGPRFLMIFGHTQVASIDAI